MLPFDDDAPSTALFVPTPAHNPTDGPKPGESPNDLPDPEQPHVKWKEDDSDPKENNPIGDPGNFGIPEKVPTPEPDYFSHDAPITEADILPVDPKTKQ